MNTTDQAFFAAYGPTVTGENSAANSSWSRKAAPDLAERQGAGRAIDSQYSQGAWYRVDSQHRDQNGHPPPHVTKVVRHPSSNLADSTSLEIGSWSTMDESPSSNLVFAGSAPIAPAEMPVIPDSETERVDQESIKSPSKIGFTEEIGEPDRQVEVRVHSKMPWKAQWEVDEFTWPEELSRLQSEQTEYFRYAGEKLRDASREGLRILAVVATREQEGCTTMAICLAMAAAAAGTRVALLDANLGHPELGDKLGLDFSQGWQHSVTGKASASEAAVIALDSNLTLLPLSFEHRLPGLGDPRISDLFRAIGAAFDLLVIDAGVVPDGAGMLFARGTACPVNAALVVRDLRRTSEAETLATAARLKSLGIDAIGIAENFLPQPGKQVAAA